MGLNLVNANKRLNLKEQEAQMRSYKERVLEGSDIYVGVDVHLKQWHVTILHEEEELFSGNIPGHWEDLEKLLSRYARDRIYVVYEAGYSGFWLHDQLLEWGANCIVTPPSLLPVESGNRVKTDKRDSRKLAYLLSRGMLKAIWVPSREECLNREVIRRRRQLVWDRVRVQNRIKSALYFYGIELAKPRGRWSTVYVKNLWSLRLGNKFAQESFWRFLEVYEDLCRQIEKQTSLLKELSLTDRYRDQVAILCSVYGIAMISAMEILLELGDIARFRRGEQLAAYVGLTPSQHSSGDKVRMGHITRAGKGALRGTLIEVAWLLIRHDSGMNEKYLRIRRNSGSKRAIVAIARRLLLCLRRMLLEKRPYYLEAAA
jgi:transposase